ncbi:MAG: hypothetical protein Q8P57_04200 [Candidatus Pacearchaeota archaeon]|nr:hypothetical protein [Candidatus Pacearchaeota archaeon]
MIGEVKRLFHRYLKDKSLDFFEDGRLFSLKKEGDMEKELENIFSFTKENLPSQMLNPIFYLLGELSDNINQHSSFSEGFIFLSVDNSSKRVSIV